MLKNDNNNEDMKNDLHLADDDYRHLNLPKHENVSIKDVISQLQQSSPQQASEEQASLYPFHLAQVDAQPAPAAPVENADQPLSEEAQNKQAVEDAVSADDEPLAEDPGVMLLPDTIDEVVRVEMMREFRVKLPIDDDGSQDLYRVKHDNRGGVDDQPRDLGIPPVDYPLPKTYTTLVAPEQLSLAPVEPECCKYDVQINITSKLLYLGENCEEYQEGRSYSSNYGWGEGGPLTPNYTIVFNSCDGVQWLDITICNVYVGYGNTQRNSYSNEYQQSYDDCCTTYRIEIPASFGLDCECPILTLQTNQLFISSPWDLINSVINSVINSGSYFIDCNGNCYELTNSYDSGSSSGLTIFDSDSSNTFSLAVCECIEEFIEINPVNQPCDYSGSEDRYSFNFNFTSSDVDNDGDIDQFLTFNLQNVTDSEDPVQIPLVVGLDLSCLCPIEELVYDRSAWINYVDFVTNDGSSALTTSQALEFFSNNGFFEDCEDNFYRVAQVPGTSTYELVQGEGTRTEMNVSFSSDLVDAPCEFDPYQFFTNNVTFTLVGFNKTSFIEVNYLGIGASLGNGYYTTYEQTIRINLPEGFILDDVYEVVVDPNIICVAYQDSCYQFGYNIEDVLYDLLDNNGIHVINTTTGEEYVSVVDDCSGDTLVPVLESDCCVDVPVNISLTNAVDSPYVTYPLNPIQNIVATYTHVVGVENVYAANLVLDSTSEAGDFHIIYTNDFNFNFTYTNCDVDNDKIIDSFLTFNFTNDYDFEITGSSAVSSSAPTDFATIQIEAPQNAGDCCSFELSFNETEFADALILRGYTQNAILNGNAALNILLQSDAIFTDCEDNNYIIVNNSGTFVLTDYDLVGPVVLDLTGNGIQLTHAADGVQYDMNHDNVKDQTAWIGSGNGLLVYDADQNHTVTDASEFVLTDHVPGAKTDLEALKIGFDSNHDSMFDQKDAAWNLFGVWQDANKDAIVDNGEYHSLAQMGIVSIGLNVAVGSKTVDSGNLIHGLGEFTWANGSKGAVADVALHYRDIVQDVHDDNSVTDPAASNPTVEQSHIVMAQNDPVVQSAIEQLAHQAAVATG